MSRLILLALGLSLTIASPASAQWTDYLVADLRSPQILVDGDRAVAGRLNSVVVTDDAGATTTQLVPAWGSNAEWRTRGLVYDGEFYLYGNSGRNSFVRTNGSVTTWEIVPGLVKGNDNGTDYSHGLSTLLSTADQLWIRTFPTPDDPYGRIFTSPDGATWTDITQAQNYGDYAFRGDDLFARAGDQLMRSTDDGATWTLAQQMDLSTVPDHGDVLIAADRLYTLVAGSPDRTLYASSDDGQTWSAVRTRSGIERVMELDGLLILQWASYDGGLHTEIGVSDDGGATWTDIVTPLYGAVDLDGGYVYVASDQFPNRKVIRAPLSAFQGGTASQAAPTARVSLAAFPSPTAGPVTLAVSLEAPADADLRVYDALGREVAVVLTGRQPGGETRAVLPALPPGAYVARVTANGAHVSRPFVVVR